MRCVRCKSTDGGCYLCAECRRELHDLKRDAQEITDLIVEASEAFVAHDPTAVTRSLQKLLRRDPHNVSGYEMMILAHGHRGRFDRALEYLDDLHRIPMYTADVARNAATERHRGRSPALEGARRRAGLDARAARSASVSSAAKGVAEAGQTLTATSRVRERAPLGAAADLLDLALFYRQVGELDLAQRVLSRVVAAGEVAPEAHLILGSVYRGLGRPRLALSELKKVRVAGEGMRDRKQPRPPEHAALAYEMALCHETLGQLKKATTLCTAAIALEPDNPFMHLSLGMLYEKQNRSRLARRAYRVASSLNIAFAPALVDISLRLGQEALESGNLDRALAEFNAGVTENPQLFPTHVVNEIEHMISHLVESEQFTTFIEETPQLQGLSDRALADLEETFALVGRLAYFVGLSCYWDSCGETQSHDDDGADDTPVVFEPGEPHATWLSGVGPSGRLLRGASVSYWRGRRGDKADEGRAEGAPGNARGSGALPPEERDARMLPVPSMVGFPPVPFEFIFEEWVNVQSRLASPRIADRPLVSPPVYQKLLDVLSAGLEHAFLALELQGVAIGEEEPDSQLKVDLGMTLWATITEAYLLRVALERCHDYPVEFLARLSVAERCRQRRQFSRTIRELELAAPLLPDNASIHNFLWNLYIREGRYAEAIEHCHAVLRFTPHYLFQAAAYNDLSYCMVELGQNLNLALLYTEKARELAPQLFDAHVADTVAWLHYKEGRYEEALHRIEEVIEAGYADDHALLPTSVHFYHYGHILQALGRESEAREAFNTARDMEVDAESDWGITRRMQRERKRPSL